MQMLYFFLFHLVWKRLELVRRPRIAPCTYLLLRFITHSKPTTPILTPITPRQAHIHSTKPGTTQLTPTPSPPGRRHPPPRRPIKLHRRLRRPEIRNARRRLRLPHRQRTSLETHAKTRAFRPGRPHSHPTENHRLVPRGRFPWREGGREVSAFAGRGGCAEGGGGVSR